MSKDKYSCAACVHPTCLSKGKPGIACASYKARSSIDDATPEEWDASSRSLLGNATPPTAFANMAADLDATENHPLYGVFMAAIEQAMHGKGERHGGARTPFLEQPWKHYAELHGRGFLTGQAAKKLEEAASTRTGQAFETEVFGAMVYLGMAILHERSKA